MRKAKQVKIRRQWKAPVVTALKQDKKEAGQFPVDHYSYSSFSLFGSNPFMFKVNYVNGDRIESTSSAGQVLGSACHKALQMYFGGHPDMPVSADEGEAIKEGYAVGLEYLNSISDGFIEYGSVIPNRAKLEERYAFCYFGYVKEYGERKNIEAILVEQKLKHKIEIDGKVLPIPLKGYPDLVYRDEKGRIVIDDHKFTSRYSAEDEMDGVKLIQAVFLFLLVAAELGENPYKVRFREFKTTPNADKSPQTHVYEMVYEKIPLAFDLFYRYYADVTDALMGKAVFVPNMNAMFDKEVSILAYIHRLDIDEERAKRFKEEKVENITDFLKKRIMRDGSMKKYLDTVARKFISAKTLNYKTMQIEEKIKMKLAEHGLGVEFDSKVEGRTITLYRYEPSIGLKMSKIEAYVKDIEQVTEVSGLRVLAPIPNSGLVGFEIPNKVRTFPTETPKNDGFNLAIGETITGETRYFDIRTSPHMLVAGSTGSGKSVFLNSIIDQLLTVPNAELHLFDPKQVELFHFEGRKTVVEYQSDVNKINRSLGALVDEMEDRYRLMRKKKVRNIEGMPTMPYKFVVIDEFADIIMQNPAAEVTWELCAKHEKWNDRHDGVLINLLQTKRKLRVKEQEVVDNVIYCDTCRKHILPSFTENIMRLAQKGRAAGIHLIIATQRASAAVISGDTKVNFPTKAVFRMAKAIDSQVMIDEDGAEKLLGKGDMLFVDENGSERLQGYKS